MPWKLKEVVDQRIEFVVRALQGEETVKALCQEYGVSRSTGHLWLRRYRESGSFVSLSDRSRRPHRSPRQTASRHQERVLQLRRRYGWGAGKLGVLLAREGIELSRRTIHRILKRSGEIQAHPSHKPALRRFERSRPNQLWQMDFKGEYRLESGGRCYPLSIVDDHSRYCVSLQALAHPNYQEVSSSLVKTFQRYGLPEAMLFDHGSPWWGSANQLGLTRLGVDLIEQGIGLYFSGVGHPQTQGKVERFHRTLSEAVRHRGRQPQVFHQWAPLLKEIRQEYNQLRPHEAIGMQAPSRCYRPSRRAYNPAPPPWQYPTGWQVRRIGPSGSFSWQCHHCFVSQALVGKTVGVLQVQDHLLVRYRQMYLCHVNLLQDQVHSWMAPVPRRFSTGQENIKS